MAVDGITTQGPVDSGHDDGLAKRHFYVCGGQTLSWSESWYFQPWFTSHRASYDSAASLGPVSPPLQVITTVPACSAAISAESAISSIVAGASTTEPMTITTTVVQGRTSNGVVGSTTFTTTFTSPTAATSAGSSTSRVSSSVSATVGPTAAAQGDLTSTCAGDWDWQGWATVASLGSGLVIGGLLWILWFGLRARIPAMFSPRSWMVPTDSQPSRTWSVVAFLLPFLHLPSLSSPLSEGQLSLHSMFASLKLASLASLLALAGALPLVIAGIPCLVETAPTNNLGGRLGTLTDLSLLRLMDALDPSPGSPSTSNLLRLPPYIRSPSSIPRALMSTVAPAISSARVRIIIILVLIALFSCFGGLFVVARMYAGFAKYRKAFEERCGGMDMVVVSAIDAPGWLGWSEEGVKKWLGDRFAEEKELDVAGVFAIPDTSEWRHKLQERDRVLESLEMAEATYIKSFHLVPTTSNGRRLESMLAAQPAPGHTSPTDFIAPRNYYKLSSGRRVSGSHERLDLPEPEMRPLASSPPPQRNPQSRFVEVNRDSSLFSKRFSIGQRIKVNEQGQYVPDPSPESESHDPMADHEDGSPGLGSTHDEQAGVGATAGPDEPSPGLLSVRPPLAGQTSDSSGESSAPSSSGPPTLVQTGPARRVEMQELPLQQGAERRAEVLQPPTAAGMASQRPSHEQTSPLGQNYGDIRDARAGLKALNGEIEAHQREAFTRLGKGENVLGWVIVGRGVRWLPCAQPVQGRTREDVDWENVGKSSGELSFWIKVVIVGLCLGIIVVPFIGLTVATAPGFAHYLAFLKPLRDSDGFGSGVAEGLAPAVALSLATCLALFATNRSAKQVRSISHTRKQMLAFKATFNLLLFILVFWLIAVAALEFGVSRLVDHVQSARFVGDGAVFSTWFIFVALLNVAVVVPALYLLQPKRLWSRFRARRKVFTPRQRFRRNLPSSFTPSYALAPFLIAVFYAFSLIFIFPLLAIPLMLLLFLSFIALRYMIDRVYVDRHGSDTSATIGLWMTLRFGLLLALQPMLYGLILLSRREWAIGGASLGVALVTLLLVFGVTVLRYPSPRRKDLSTDTRRALDGIRSMMIRPRSVAPPSSSVDPSDPGSRSRYRSSDSSMLRRLAALLPGYARLPPECPLPLPTEWIDDLFFTEKASQTRRDVQTEDDHNSEEARHRQRFYDPTESLKGLVYPPEMLAPNPVVWLERDEAGVAEGEAADLVKHHDLPAIVDPVPNTSLARHSSLHSPTSPSPPPTRQRSGAWRRRRTNSRVGHPAEPSTEATSPLLT